MVIDMSSDEEHVEKKHEVEIEKKSDVEEMREVFEILTPFIEKLKDMAKELVIIVTQSIDGKKLGEEATALYKELKEAGLPDDVVNEMVRDFFNKKLEMAPSLGELFKSLNKAIKFKTGEKGVKIITEEEFEKEEEEEKE